MDTKLEKIVAKVKAKPRNLWTEECKGVTNKCLHSCLKAENIDSYNSFKAQSGPR